MKTFSIIGIDPLHYEEIIHDKFVSWIIDNTSTVKEFQLCLISKPLHNYYKSKIRSIEINFATHISLLQKNWSNEERKALFFEYLKRIDLFFPRALKPRTSSREIFNASYN